MVLVDFNDGLVMFVTALSVSSWDSKELNPATPISKVNRHMQHCKRYLQNPHA